MLRASFSIASIAAAIACSGVVACNKESAGGAPAPAASSAATPNPAASPAFPIPGGPRLAILAGQGVGPIRIGASTATIERLMGEPCEEKTPTACRYPNRALEFVLGPDGMTKQIHIHRMGRDAGGGKRYGIFNGAIPPDLRFDMLVSAVQQYLGPPDRVEAGNAGAVPETAEQHHYKGMVLEYDRLQNGKLVLGGVRIPN
jgi:hypothetical protein